MNTSSGETHTATTNADSRQTTTQGREMTHVRRFLAAARVLCAGWPRQGGAVKAVVAVTVGALLAGGLAAPAGRLACSGRLCEPAACQLGSW